MTDRDTTEPGNGRTGATYGSLRPEPAQAASPSKSPMVDLSQKAKEDVAQVRDMAKEQISQAASKAEDMADSQKGYAAERVAGIAQAIEKVGAELEQGDNKDVGRMARQMGESVHRFADDIKGRSMGEIAGMAEDFGRRQPLAFLGLAAMAGLAASRFVSASASRQESAPSRAPSYSSNSGVPTSAQSPAVSTATPVTPRPTGASNV